MSTLHDPLDDLRKLKTARGRMNWLQKWFGPKAEDSAELHRRALLVTRIREAKLWPQ